MLLPASIIFHLLFLLIFSHPRMEEDEDVARSAFTVVAGTYTSCYSWRMSEADRTHSWKKYEILFGFYFYQIGI